jgi:cytoskeletal protein RodZ
LPSDVFAVGFIRRYAKLLSLDPEVAATIFRRERAAAKTSRKKSFSFGPAKSSAQPRFVVSSRVIVALLAGLVVLLLFGYIWFQVRQFAAPPQIALQSPAEDTISPVETVMVAGTTSPTATLFINSEPVPLDERGGFRQDVKLTTGVNTIEIKAVNRLGKEATKIVNVLFEIPTSPVITPPAEPLPNGL